jgi:hypothetical protein
VRVSQYGSGDPARDDANGGGMKKKSELLRDAIREAARETWRQPWEKPTGPKLDFDVSAKQARLSNSKQYTLWNRSTFKEQWKKRPAKDEQKLEKQVGQMAFTLALHVTSRECIVMLAEWLRRYGRPVDPAELAQVTNSKFEDPKLKDAKMDKRLWEAVRSQVNRDRKREDAGSKNTLKAEQVLAALPATRDELRRQLDVSINSIDSHLKRLINEGKVERIGTVRPYCYRSIL